MLRVASENLTKLNLSNWRLAQADNRNLPIITGSANVILAGWTLGHLTEWHQDSWQPALDKVMTELDRILAPQGTIILFETLGTCQDTAATPTLALGQL
jgi:ubiquinone/menaquinone biosynthesis C-methylase UbiE